MAYVPLFLAVVPLFLAYVPLWGASADALLGAVARPDAVPGGASADALWGAVARPDAVPPSFALLFFGLLSFTFFVEFRA